jgi:ribosomal protein S18 acetylase RimI-like enzyme
MATDGRAVTPGDLVRAFDFIVRADMAGTRNEPFRWGLSIRMPECPLRHDSNYLLVDPVPAGVGAADLAAEAERVQGAAGLGHRLLFFRDAARAEGLAPALEAAGWTTSRGVVMAHRRPPAKAAPPAAVVARADPAALLGARTAEILGYPWGTPEVARQLLSVRDLIPVETRHYAVFEDGAPVSWAELYLEGTTAQVEAVATVEAFRNRGHATAVVLHAVDEARRAGADFVFLCADAEDWPQALYGRLGFDEIGRYVKFTKRIQRPSS